MSAKNNSQLILIILSMFVSILYSCENSNKNFSSSKRESDAAQIEILIRDKLCAHLIKYDLSGKGSLVKGDVDNFDNNKYFFTKIRANRSFVIKSKKELDSINESFSKLKKLSFKRYKTFDGNHLLVFIAGKIVVDSYSEAPNEYQVIEGILSRNLPFKIDYNCQDLISN